MLYPLSYGGVHASYEVRSPSKHGRQTTQDRGALIMRRPATNGAGPSPLADLSAWQQAS
jgi:hypothetical protein